MILLLKTSNLIRLFYYLKDFYYLCILNIRDMTCERMLELYLLTQFSYAMNFDGKLVDRKAFEKRRLELLREFFEPYVIDNAEKSE